MNLNLNQKTESYAEMVARLFKHMESPQATLIHAAVGMTGECGELFVADLRADRENLIEELGDWRFYFQFLVAKFEWDLAHLTGHALDDPELQPIENLIIYSCEVQDQLKKHWVYNRELDVQKLQTMAGLAYVSYCQLLGKYALTDKDICDANQYKLSTGPNARYPLGYSDAAAIARADKLPGA